MNPFFEWQIRKTISSFETNQKNTYFLFFDSNNEVNDYSNQN